MFPVVMKFGGAALADGPGVQRVCKIIREHRGERRGERPIVVVSAHLGVTDLLETVARSAAEGHLEGDRVRIRHRTILRQLDQDSELLDRYFNELFHLLAAIKARGRLVPSERDMVLSYGERMSARIVAQALSAAGSPATPVDAFDLGLTTDSHHGEARPVRESQTAIRAALGEVSGIPVVTGFLAKDAHGNLTTLGRNGSDLTAALVAEAVGAEELQLWKAVGGMMTADPRIVAEARVIESIGFQEAAEYAFHGAEVLLAAALVPAQRANLSVRVLDVNDPAAPGTLLSTHTREEGPVGIAARRKVVRVDVELALGEPRAQRLGEVAATFARQRLDPGLFTGNAERISLIVPPSPALDVVLLELGRGVSVEHDLALAAVIGRSVGYDSGIALRAQSLLAEAQIEVVAAFVGSRLPSQAFLVRASDLERAVRALHAGLLRERGARV